jgi:hypothetical protein
VWLRHCRIPLIAPYVHRAFADESGFRRELVIRGHDQQLVAGAGVERAVRFRVIRLYDHIIELRTELRSCYVSSPRERAAITAELDQALARQAELDRDYANNSGG